MCRVFITHMKSRLRSVERLHRLDLATSPVFSNFYGSRRTSVSRPAGKNNADIETRIRHVNNVDE
jgi:hypothetical protein